MTDWRNCEACKGRGMVGQLPCVACGGVGRVPYPELNADEGLIDHLRDYGAKHGQTAQMTSILRYVGYLEGLNDE